MLMEKKLIRALGRKDIPGRPLIYATTKQFLALFDLKDLKDLPSLKEIEAFGKQSQAMLDEEEYPDESDQITETDTPEPPPFPESKPVENELASDNGAFAEKP